MTENMDHLSADGHTHVLFSTDARHHRFHLLDALRGIAAFLVILWHAPAAIYPRDHHSMFLAVDFFFCLSGFVVAFSYERRLQDELTFRDFVAARVIRLYPIYLLGIGIGAFLFQGALPKLEFTSLLLKQLLLLPSYNAHAGIFLFPLDFPSWSIFFELLTNFIFAALVRWKLSRLSHLVLLAAISFIILAMSHTTAQTIDVGAANDRAIFHSALARALLSFLLGVFMHRIRRHYNVKFANTRLHGLIAVGLAVALFVVLDSPTALMYNRAFSIVDITVIFPMLILIGACLTIPRAWIPMCAFLGDLSYPLYLLHAHAALLVQKIFGLPGVSDAPNHSMRGLIALSTMGCLIACCVLANKYYDVPIRRFLRVRYSRLSERGEVPVIAA